MIRLPSPLILVAALGVAGCGDDLLGPVDSTEFTLTVNSMNSSDIEPEGVIEKDENISTETSNPWGIFVRQAEDQCQAAPTSFELLSASLTLDVDGSSDVAVFEDVIDGDVTVFFASTRGSDLDAVRVHVASTSLPVGAGPVPLAVTATPGQLQVLHERLLGGDFHVGVNAETDRVDTDSFSMDVQVTLQARAHCG